MLTAHYHNPEEFLSELRSTAEAGGLAYPFIRLTTLYVPSTLTPNIHYVSVVTTFVAWPPTLDQYLVRLDRYVGEVWHLDNGRDGETYAKRDEVQAEIGTVAGELGIDIRGGTWGPVNLSTAKEE